MNAMRRYRMINGTFDTRSHFVVGDIPLEWEPNIRAQHWTNRRSVMEGLKYEFGEENLGEKVAEFGALGPEPFSVVAYHNLFFRQVRRSFVFGSHYPAVVGCCALGERILNHLIHEFREDFKGTPEYKLVYDKESFDDWTRAIDVLEAWEILLPDVADDYRRLRTKRNDAIHFRPETSTRARDMAFEAIGILGGIIQLQFGSLGAQPWYFGMPGETYIKKDAEERPFVRKVLVPEGLHVGPSNQLDFDVASHEWSVADVGDVGPDEGTDDQFIELRNHARQSTFGKDSAQHT
jgi:hypothetical protein